MPHARPLTSSRRSTRCARMCEVVGLRTHGGVTLLASLLEYPARGTVVFKQVRPAGVYVRCTCIESHYRYRFSTTGALTKGHTRGMRRQTAPRGAHGSRSTSFCDKTMLFEQPLAATVTAHECQYIVGRLGHEKRRLGHLRCEPTR